MWFFDFLDGSCCGEGPATVDAAASTDYSNRCDGPVRVLALVVSTTLVHSYFAHGREEGWREGTGVLFVVCGAGEAETFVFFHKECEADGFGSGHAGALQSGELLALLADAALKLARGIIVWVRVWGWGEEVVGAVDGWWSVAVGVAVGIGMSWWS